MELNENQKIALDYLKHKSKMYNDPMLTIVIASTQGINDSGTQALAMMDNEEKFEVLKVFAEWGLENV